MPKIAQEKTKKGNKIPLLKIAQNIKLLVLDVDGVLTSGELWYTEAGEEIKVFHVQDGFGMKALLDSGIEIAIISGRKSAAVSKRMSDLGVKYVYQGINDKMPIFEDLIKRLNVGCDQVAYMGDDLPDLPIITRVGLGVAVSNANKAVLKCAKLVTKACGGKGAVREVCDLLLECCKFAH